MKRVFKDILFGILIVIVVTICEFLVTLPFGDPGTVTSGDYAAFINRELWLAAIPAGLVTFAFAWLLKTKTNADALRRSIVWTVVLGLEYLLIGIGNGNIAEIYGSFGIYALLLCAFAGPLVFSRVKHLA